MARFGVRMLLLAQMILVPSAVIAVQVEIVRPALLPQADGKHGELYGPISALLPYWYLTAALLIVMSWLVLPYVASIAWKARPKTNMATAESGMPQGLH